MNYKGGFVGTILPLWLVVSVVMLAMWSLMPFAQAAALTDKSDTQSSLKAATTSDHSVLFTTPTGLVAAETIILTWTSFTVGSGLDFNDVDLSTDDTPDGICDTGDTERTMGSSASGATWGVATSTDSITFTSGTDTIVAGGEVCIEVGTGAEQGGAGNTLITNPSAGNYTLAISGTIGAPDSGSIAIVILADDQIAVSATVTESLTFTISDNSIGFGTLNSGNARYATGDTNGTTTADTAGHNLIIGTNATNGYTTTINGATLNASGPTITAIGATATTSNPGAEQFGVGFTVSGSGSGTATAPYATASQYAFDTAAFPDQVNSAAAATANNTYDARYIANIASNTDAGSYTATLTYISTANF